MDSFLIYILAGAAVGFTVGLTGVGGGSIMTPLLLAFGFPPHVAVGTDLLYAGITKGGGVVWHAKEQRVDWIIAFAMAAGSIPAAILTIVFLSYFGKHFEDYGNIFTVGIGIMLIATAAMLLFRQKLFAHANSPKRHPWLFYAQSHSLQVSVISGIVLGIAVTITSVGAGVIGTAILLTLFPFLKANDVVGTELAHAVPLALIAGLGHLWLGHVDFELLAALLIGSLPATYFGVRAGKHMPEQIMRPLLILVLVSAGIKCALF